MNSKLGHDFFNRHTVEVAIDLLGKKICFNNQSGIITETEAYRGFDDAASHAYRGPTKRSQIMFGQAGYSYIYLIYGMHNCLNFVTEPEGFAGAVLIRGIKVPKVVYSETNGPGKLTKHFTITRSFNGINVIQDNSLYLTEAIKVQAYNTSPRIGISVAKEKLWRFCLSENELKQLD